MAERILQILLLIVGVIHVLPITGVLGASRLARLYGVSVNEPNLDLLMRHRAVLLALVGAVCVAAAAHAPLRTAALAAGFVSVVSFLGLALPAGTLTAEIRTVVIVDVILLACLAVALGLHIRRA